MSAGAPRRPVEAFDDALFRVERLVVAAILVVMGGVVFLDVVLRVSTAEGSRLGNPLVVGVVAAVVATLAFRTRGADGALWKGPLTGLLLVAVQQALVVALPNGLVWSQTLALALTLWLGTVGASLAAHERRHLALDVGSKMWPEALAPKAAAVGHLVTAAFCVLLLWLGGRSLEANWELWSSTDGAAGNLSGLDIPKWVPSLSIPYGMAVLAFRFTLDAWRAWRGELPTDADDTLHQLGIRADEPAGGAR